ncbi:lycopene cyclase domain-containing protein [Brevibacterium yomogidense]|uniref:lycopene cyclase domain-containing protein n=1 Tax=Brevibacterium yomogidense TaxID=946573 RepID=UPI0018DFC493|nr:lycopene cyclase domain-containing protein [Brevibacterium yomogidense]
MSYLTLNVPFVATALVVLIAAVALRRIPVGRACCEVVFTAVVLCTLTAVFDSLMIHAGLFEYAEHTLIGMRVGLAPLEDFAYPLVAALLLPGLRWLLVPAPAEQ